MSSQVRFRIRLIEPPPGVEFALQRGKAKDATALDARQSDGSDLAFEFEAAVKEAPDGSVDFGGPFVQGPRGARFFYLTVRRLGTGSEAPWDGRVKVPLGGIARSDVEKAIAGSSVLEASYEATSPKGGPRYATVPLTSPWRATTA